MRIGINLAKLHLLAAIFAAIPSAAQAETSATRSGGVGVISQAMGFGPDSADTNIELIRYDQAECCSCESGCSSSLLGEWLLPSDPCFSNFISPMTNPVYFEDPRTLTELRFIYLHHKIDPTISNSAVQLLAVQARVALTERLSIVASKDGYILADGDAPLDDGWADIAAGLKYNLYSDCCCQRILSAGFAYELPVGSTRSLQGNGDGEFHLYLTGGAELAHDIHWISATGFRLPVDRSEESSMWYWSNHWDKRLGCSNFYGLFEVNWFHWMGSGDQTALPGVEGGDLFNFGSTGVAGNDIVTGAIGLKYKPSCHTELGVAWEVPLTDRRDLLDNRLTIDFILRY